MVLAVGALGFGVVGHLRADELEEQVADLRAATREPRTAAPAATTTSTTSSTTTTSTTTAPGGAGAVAVTGDPLDPVVARRAIEVAFDAVYDGGAGSSVRIAAVDDPTGIEDALRVLYLGPSAEAARTSSATVSAVSFTSPTRAAVGYTVAVAGVPELAVRLGEARIAGGSWKVTRATVCADLAVLEAPCG